MLDIYYIETKPFFLPICVFEFLDCLTALPQPRGNEHSMISLAKSLLISKLYASYTWFLFRLM